MPNLKKPDGLVLKKGMWNKLCISCKRGVIRNKIIADLEIFLCYKCCSILSNKKGKKCNNDKPYKIRPVCYGCNKRFEADNLGRKYCYDCRPVK